MNNRPVDDRKDKYLKIKEQIIALNHTPLGKRSPWKRGHLVSLGTRTLCLAGNEVEGETLET